MSNSTRRILGLSNAVTMVVALVLGVGLGLWILTAIVFGIYLLGAIVILGGRVYSLKARRDAAHSRRTDR
jgi:hypothetical protein